MELYVARHGETEFNIERRIQGSGMDSPLTSNGIAQAKALGKSLEGINFDAVYSSPLKRTVATVETAFCDRYKPILDPRLVEIGMGVMEGMLWDDIAELYPNATRLDDPVNFIPPPNGEALPDMIGRVGAFMDEISTTGHQTVFVMTHGYTLRVFQACTMGRTLEALAKTTRAYRNCEVARYRYKQGKWDIL